MQYVTHIFTTRCAQVASLVYTAKHQKLKHMKRESKNVYKVYKIDKRINDIYRIPTDVAISKKTNSVHVYLVH